MEEIGKKVKRRKSTRVILDPPAFRPPPEMRGAYLGRRKSELDAMLDSGRNGEWKMVFGIVNHVRGTGAMYGFDVVGQAAEELAKAVQNGDENCLGYLDGYVAAVNAAQA